MDHMAAAEERIVTERLRQKLNEVNSAAQTQLSPIQDHVNFTLQLVRTLTPKEIQSSLACFKLSQFLLLEMFVMFLCMALTTFRLLLVVCGTVTATFVYLIAGL